MSVGTPRRMGTPIPLDTPLVLNTHPDVFVEESRVAGIDIGMLFNQWLKCPWMVASSPGTSAYRWTSSFYAEDDGTRQDFKGVAGTRAEAKFQAFAAITKRISSCVEHRKRWMARYNAAQVQSLAAGVPVAG